MITGRQIKCPACGEFIEVPDRFHDFPCPKKKALNKKTKCETKIHDEKGD